MGEFTPVQEKQRERAAEKYGIKNNDYWYLELLFTNPEDEGRGKSNFILLRLSEIDCWFRALWKATEGIRGVRADQAAHAERRLGTLHLHLPSLWVEGTYANQKMLHCG